MTKEEIQKLMVLVEQYKEQINSLEYQNSYIQAAITDYNRAKMTLEKLGNEEKNTDLLLPIGGSSYIDAKANDPSKVLFDIGSGYVIEKSTEDSIKNIDKRIEDLQKSQEKVNAMIEQFQTEANNATMKAQKLYQETNK